jgi:hypothetical protein
MKSYFTSVVLLVSLSLYSCSKVVGPDGSTISDITITSLRPAHGPFGTIDTIIGKGFDKIPVLDSVLLNGKKLTLISRTPEQVIVKIPEMAGTGPIDIWYEGKVIHGPVFNYDSTLFVTTLAGSSREAGAIDGQGSDARFNNPQGIAVDGSGNVYVADMHTNAIRKITEQGTVTTLAGALGQMGAHVDGKGTAARFGAPAGLAIGPDGFLYVGDHYNYRVRKVSLSGDVTTLAGVTWNTGPLSGQIDGNASIATFNAPYGVTVDSKGNVYVADLYNHKVRKITPAGMVSTLAGGGYYHSGHQDGPTATALFQNTYHVAADPFGNIYATEAEGYNYIRKISPDGMVSTVFGPKYPEGSDYLFSGGVLATDKAGNLFFSIPEGILKRTPDGRIIRYAVGGIGEVDGPANVATYRSIQGIAIDSSNNLYITDNNRIRKIAWK